MINVSNNLFSSKKISESFRNTECGFFCLNSSYNFDQVDALEEAANNGSVDLTNFLNSVKEHFSAMFFSSVKNKVYLIRDRFGMNQLFYSLDDEKIYFSNSAKEIALFLKKDIDKDYCARGAKYKIYDIAESASAYEGVYSVPPGCFVSICLRTLEIENIKWYDLYKNVAQKSATIKNNSEKELTAELRQLLEKSIAKSLINDTKNAITLSGGLDSSGIASIAKQQGADIVPFSFSNPSALLSEGPEVEEVAKYLNINVEYVWPEFSIDNIEKLLVSTMTAQEAPFIGIGAMAQNYLFSKVSESGFFRILGGQGSDEIFAGYRKFFIVALKEAINNKEFFNALKFGASLSLMLLSELGKFKQYSKNLHRYKKEESPRLKLLNLSIKPHNLLDGSLSLSNRQIQDITHWSLPTLLRLEGNNAKFNNIQSFYPFLDTELVELALATPAKYKIKRGYGKWVLRKALEGLVPNKIRLTRKKRGFDVTQNWVENGLGSVIHKFLEANFELIKPYIREDFDLNLINNYNLAKDSDLLDESLILFWIASYKLDLNK